MRLVVLLVVALCAPALAGCLSGGEAETQGLDATAPAAAAPAQPSLAGPVAPTEVPLWRPGDAWVVESRFRDETRSATLVVTEASSDAYTLASTDESMATFDAAFDVSYLGRVRASDLAGSQRDEPVQFFRFPLSDGATWSTRWDGETIDLIAVFVPTLSTPIGPQPGYRIEGTNASGGAYVHYDFVPALRWWSHLDFEEGYGFKVTAVRENWTGEYAVATSKEVLSLTTAAPVGSTPAGTFMVDEGATSLLVMLMGSAPAYARALQFVDPAGAPVATHDIPQYEQEASASRVFYTETLAATPGEWRVLAPVVHHPEGHFALNVMQVTIEKRVRAAAEGQ